VLLGASPVRPLIGWQVKALFLDFGISELCFNMLYLCFVFAKKYELARKKISVIKNGNFGGTRAPL
jgi:hypothetical protein